MRRGLGEFSQVQGANYFAIREELAADLRRGIVQPTPEALTDRIALGAGVDRAQASECAERFLADVQRGLER